MIVPYRRDLRRCLIGLSDDPLPCKSMRVELAFFYSVVAGGLYPRIRGLYL